jgi:cytochrome c5
VKDVFKNSCMGCHATGGKGMAMAKLNFSEWDSYSAEKQAKKAEAICNVITKGSMPPKSFRQSHPEAIPTDAQKELICKWSKTCAEK